MAGVAAGGAPLQGSVTRQPWSGNWWPQLDGQGQNMYDEGGPLALYDEYVKRTRGYDPGARAWEYQNRRTEDPKLDWAGSCHAWAAASMLTPEAPREGVTRAGVQFNQDALEGLVTNLYYDPQVQWLAGTRSETDDPNANEFKDLNPAWMHYLLDYYITKNDTPFIMDTSAGSQVWNFPVFAYQSSQSQNADGSFNFNTRVWYGDAKAGAAGTSYFTKDYTYTLRSTPDGRMDGEWTGASVNDHPDFAWIATGRNDQGRNPRVDPEIVSEILGYRV